MTTLIEPPMIAVMEPLKVAQKAISDWVKNYGFSPPFGGEFFSDCCDSFSVGTFVPWDGYAIGDGSRFQVGDFNGDDKADLIHFVNTYVHTWLSLY
jgi:hypothetical protein